MCYEVPGAARAGTWIPHHGSVSGQQVPGATRAGTIIPVALDSARTGTGWPPQRALDHRLLWRCVSGVDQRVALQPLSTETSELY